MADRFDGPWSIHPKFSYIMNKNGVAIDQLTKNPHRHPDMMEKARLIAAAPELLEALKDLLESTGIDGTFANKARAAIAKVEGK